MSKLLIILLALTPVVSYSDDCKTFENHKFVGIFRVAKISCNERGLESVCQTELDQFSKVSEVKISFAPLGVERGLFVELIEYRLPGLQDTVAKYVFAEVTLGPKEKLTCSHTKENSMNIYQLKRELSSGDFNSYSKIVKTGENVEFEISTSLGSSSSTHKFLLSK